MKYVNIYTLFTLTFNVLVRSQYITKYHNIQNIALVFSELCHPSSLAHFRYGSGTSNKAFGSRIRTFGPQYGQLKDNIIQHHTHTLLTSTTRAVCQWD